MTQFKWRFFIVSIQITLADYFSDCTNFTTKEAEKLATNRLGVNAESVRARIYEGVAKGIFEKLSRGVYRVKKDAPDSSECLLINGDGRDLSYIENDSIDGIVTDHPYDLSKTLDGGNRHFATYDRFRYTERDFAEKYRVLKDGCFLVEFLPEESADNYEYLYQIKEMAKKAGFKYYAKVPWKKGSFVANTGRKAKNTEDVVFFTKGEPRALKLDTKKNIATAKAHGVYDKKFDSYSLRDVLIENNLEVSFMKGTDGMLPTMFDVQPRSKKEKVMEAEKPVELLEEIIGYISRPYEVLLDQFTGSANFLLACLNTNRYGMGIEADSDIIRKSIKNINNQEGIKVDEVKNR